MQKHTGMASLFYINPLHSGKNFITMKLLLLSLLFSFAISVTIAQNAPEVQEVRKSGPVYNEVFNVLKKDGTPHGAYNKYRRFKLETSGFYYEGKQDSTWIEYFDDKPITIKHFSHGERVGEWDFYDTRGNLEVKYNFATGELIDRRRNADSIHNCLIPDESGHLQPAKLDRKVVPLQSPGEFLRFQLYNLQYPIEAQDKNEQGLCLIAITIDENGKAVDYKIHRSASKSLGKEALRVVKLFNGEFLPGIQNGQKVKCVFLMPVIFKLEGVG